MGTLLTLAMLSACTSDPEDVATRRRPPQQTNSPTTQSEVQRPSPNVVASEIRVVMDHGEDHPAPEVLPQSPLHLVIDSCAGLAEIPPNDDSVLDPENEILAVYWWDPGIRESRSLTILYESPSCRSHPGVSGYLKPA